jgi:hypothetical protein
MKFPLHLLHLEDDPNDAALMRSTLEAGADGWVRHTSEGREGDEWDLQPN